MLLGLDWKAWYTIVVVVSLFLVLLYTKLRTDVAFLGCMALLFIPGVLDLKGAFGGFAQESVLVVAVMFCVIAGLDNTGVLNWVARRLMGTPKGLNRAIIRVMAPAALLSSVLSNTTVVALFVNVVRKWSRKLNIAPSKLLIPLSYASCLGGICTLIGTPPNMLISGMYAKETGIQMGIFAPALCGLFCLAAGVAAMLLMHRLLPTRKSPMDNVLESHFTTVLTVPSNNILIGKGIGEACTEAGQNTDNIKITAIRRFDNEIVAPVNSDEPIMGTDRILVSGPAGELKYFAHRMGFRNDVLETAIEQETRPEGSDWRTLASALTLVLAIVLAAFNVIPLLKAGMLAALIMLILGCCTPAQSFKAIDFSILMVFAGSIAIGTAIQQTGLAQLIAHGLLDVCGTNPYVVFAAICLVGTFVTEFISNTAAGAIFYPIAMSAATSIGANPMTFCIGLMIAVSSSFATPIGSPTHMLVYMPGGYRFSDFARVGIPMNFIILAANILITPLVYPF